jgi:hypothetical protein
MTEKRLLDGADEFLQLFNLLSFIKMIINGSVLDIKSNII